MFQPIKETTPIDVNDLVKLSKGKSGLIYKIRKYHNKVDKYELVSLKSSYEYINIVYWHTKDSLIKDGYQIHKI